MKNYNFIDLCAGIGGFRTAFNPYGKCLLTCEIDKFCKQTYTANYDDQIWMDDIKKISPKNLNDFDILCAGFPCQAFSLAGKQLGFADIRGTIFLDITNILKTKNPSAFVLENVKNLKSHDKGNTFKVINKTLDDLNYWHQDFLINSQYFVPQKRQRIYIVGLRKDKFSHSEFEILLKNISNQYEMQQTLALPKFKDILEKNVDKKYTLSPKLWAFLQAHAKKHSDKGNGFGFGLMQDNDISSRTLTARYYKDGSEILVAQDNQIPRKLTPRECARLMGYSDSFKIVVSDTQAYKQFGNSVVVPVISMLAGNLIKCLEKK